jgi:exonuclease VII small subunit
MDQTPQFFRWMPIAVILAMIVYTIQLTARLTADEALLQATAATVQARSPVFEQVIRMESRLASIEEHSDAIENIPVELERNVAIHASINDRMERLARIVDRLESQIDGIIEALRAERPNTTLRSKPGGQ